MVNHLNSNLKDLGFNPTKIDVNLLHCPEINDPNHYLYTKTQTFIKKLPLVILVCDQFIVSIFQVLPELRLIVVIS